MCTALDYGLLCINYIIATGAFFKAWELFKLQLDRRFAMAMFVCDSLMISIALTGCLLNDSYLFNCSIPVLFFLLAMAETANMLRLRLFQEISPRERVSMLVVGAFLWLTAVFYLIEFLGDFGYSVAVAVMMVIHVCTIETILRIREIRIVYGSRKNCGYDTDTFKQIQRNRRDATAMLGMMMFIIGMILVLGLTLATPASTRLAHCIIYLISSIVGACLLVIDNRVIEIVKIKSKAGQAQPQQQTTTLEITSTDMTQ